MNTLNAIGMLCLSRIKFFSSVKLDTFAQSPDTACNVTNGYALLYFSDCWGYKVKLEN